MFLSSLARFLSLALFARVAHARCAGARTIPRITEFSKRIFWIAGQFRKYFPESDRSVLRATACDFILFFSFFSRKAASKSVDRISRFGAPRLLKRRPQLAARKSRVASSIIVSGTAIRVDNTGYSVALVRAARRRHDSAISRGAALENGARARARLEINSLLAAVLARD